MLLATTLPTMAADQTINIVHTSDMSGTIFKNEETGTVGYGNILSVRERNCRIKNLSAGFYLIFLNIFVFFLGDSLILTEAHSEVGIITVTIIRSVFAYGVGQRAVSCG